MEHFEKCLQVCLFNGVWHGWFGPHWLVLYGQNSLNIFQNIFFSVVNDNFWEDYPFKGVFTSGKSDSSYALVWAEGKKLYIVAIFSHFGSFSHHTVCSGPNQLNLTKTLSRDNIRFTCWLDVSLNVFPKLLFDQKERPRKFKIFKISTELNEAGMKTPWETSGLDHMYINKEARKGVTSCVWPDLWFYSTNGCCCFFGGGGLGLKLENTLGKKTHGLWGSQQGCRELSWVVRAMVRKPA